MALDVGVLQDLAEHVRGHVSRADKLNEANTKAVLVEPLLEWLGWNVRDPAEVSREWRRKGNEEPVDYALFGDNGAKLLLVEAKPLNDPLRADKGWRQLAANGFSAGFRWAVRTNGRSVILVNLAHTAELEEKVFWEADLAAIGLPDGTSPQEAADRLGLLAKDSLTAGQPERAWEDHHAHRKARDAVEALLRRPPSELLNMVRKEADDPRLPDEAISSCLTALIGRQEAGHRPPRPTREKQEFMGVCDLVEAGLVRPGDRWRMKGEGLRIAAEVTTEGQLLVKGRRYPTPYAAACAAAGKRVSGWRSWEFKDSEGRWRPVSDLRRKLWRARHHVPARKRPESKAGFTVEAHLAGKPGSRAIWEALTRAISGTVGEFKAHASSRDIVLSARVAFLVAKVRADGLRVGLRLDASEARRHDRLDVAPRGRWSGWNRFGVSTALRTPNDIDEELVGLIKRACEAAS